jgi:hypothetical protein
VIGIPRVPEVIVISDCRVDMSLNVYISHSPNIETPPYGINDVEIPYFLLWFLRGYLI